jgi:hypothetical protein
MINVTRKPITRKSDLFKNYPGLKDSEIRNTINDIIAKKRKIDLRVAKFQQKLYPSEVALFEKEVDPIYKGPSRVN